MTIQTGAKLIFVIALVWPLVCLWIGHRASKVNLWDCVTIKAKDGAVYTDPKKVTYMGGFVVMATAFAYFTVVDQLTDWYAAIFVSAFIIGKWLGDREQRLGRSADAPKAAAGT